MTREITDCEQPHSAHFTGQKKAQLFLLRFINDFQFKPHLNHLYQSESPAHGTALRPTAKHCSQIFQNQSVVPSNIPIESNQRAGSHSNHILSSQIYSFSEHFSKRAISENIWIWMCVWLSFKGSGLNHFCKSEEVSV